MSLADRLKAGPVRQADLRDKMNNWLNTLSESDRIAAIGTMVDTRWSSTDLLAEFRDTGFDGSVSLINTYRRKLRDAR